MSAHIVPSVGLDQRGRMGGRVHDEGRRGGSMHDEDDKTLIKSNNTSDPHARCRGRVEEEGLDTGALADANEMRTCHGCLKPWPTAAGDRQYE